MEETQSGSSGQPDEANCWQFIGQIDKHNYREYRVKLRNLATTSDSKSANGRIQQGLKRVLDGHNNTIAELETKIRHHHQMKKQWSMLEQTANEHNRELVARLLNSSEEFITDFENENFGPTCSWSSPIAMNSKTSKQILSNVVQLDRKGKVINNSPSKKESKVCCKIEESHKECMRSAPDGIKSDRQPKSEKLMVQPNTSLVLNENSNSKTGERGSQTVDESSPAVTTKKLNGNKPNYPEELLIDTSPPPTNTLGSSSSQSGSSSRSSLNNKKKGKKGKKSHKGPKITLEEIEAIKKKKKEDADRAYEKKHKEMQEHLEKVEKSERHKIHRRLAETALEIMRRGSGILPPEIQELNTMLDDFVRITNQEEKYRLRNEYLATRIEELTRILIGPELATKMELMAVYETVIERTCHLQHYLMFLASLDKSPDEFKQFELRTVTFYLKGYEEDHEIKNRELDTNFNNFRKEFLGHIPESERWSYAQEFVDSRLSVYRDIKNTRELVQSELFLEEAYIGMDNMIEVFNKCNNVIAFLQHNKFHSSFNLMEAWFLESRRPPFLP